MVIKNPLLSEVHQSWSKARKSWKRAPFSTAYLSLQSVVFLVNPAPEIHRLWKENNQARKFFSPSRAIKKLLPRPELKIKFPNPNVKRISNLIVVKVWNFPFSSILNTVYMHHCCRNIKKHSKNLLLHSAKITTLVFSKNMTKIIWVI